METMKKFSYWMRDTRPANMLKWEHRFLVETAYDHAESITLLQEENEKLRQEVEHHAECIIALQEQMKALLKK